MKCVLVIAYEFYPFNTGGSHRPFRLALSLKQNGYEPVVITASDTAFQATYDSSLEETVSSNAIDVIRIAPKRRGMLDSLSDAYYFNITDDAWSRSKDEMTVRIEQLLAEKEVLCAIITVPPFSLVNLIQFLKRRRVRVVLDMRDAWSQWNVTPYASKLHYLLTLGKERKALQSADLVMVTSSVTLEDLKRLHDGVPGSKFLLVPNSFERYKERQSAPSRQHIDVGYFGSFYFDPRRDMLHRLSWWRKKPWQWIQYAPHKEEWIYRSPYFFFSALHELFQRFPDYRQKLRLHVAGDKPFWFDDMVARFALKSVVKHYGFLNKQEVEELQNKMHYMLITSAKRHGGKDYSIAGKTFEFMASLKPMLAFVTDGAQRDILSGTGIAIMFDPDDLGSTIDLLKRVIDREIHLTPDVEYINQYLSSNAFRPLMEGISEWQARVHMNDDDIHT